MLGRASVSFMVLYNYVITRYPGNRLDHMLDHGHVYQHDTLKVFITSLSRYSCVHGPNIHYYYWITVVSQFCYRPHLTTLWNNSICCTTEATSHENICTLSKQSVQAL